MKELNKIHHVKITTESPLSILADNGRDLSPYADYIVSEKGDMLYYVNHALVEAKLAVQPALIDELTNGIRDSMDNNRSNFNLSHFVTKRLGLSLAQFKKVPTQGNWRGKRRNVQAIAKDAERLYLAGSSLKGAMRTAILYYWLAYTEEGEREVQTIVKTLTEIAPFCKRLNELNKNRRDLKKIHKKLDFNDEKERKGLEKERDKYVNTLFNEENLFGKLNPKRGEPQTAPLSQSIICRDSQPIDGKYLIATQAERIRRMPENKNFASKSVIPQPREAIAKGATLLTSFSIRQNGAFDNSDLSYLNEDTAWILKTLTNFALDFVKFEIEKLEEGVNTADINGLIDFYYALNNRIGEGETFLRLGAGKTFYDNSLVLSLLMHPDETIKNQSGWDLRTVFPNDIKSLHPVTRTIAADGQPFGWVKVEAV